MGAFCPPFMGHFPVIIALSLAIPFMGPDPPATTCKTL
ncbi:hypothetical protein BARBAKC583_0162 [Bartonella bacilliformis KC583]|uniref:Uncharacterized protein n=1 Tax=Bartonella bacilliformis (strain ATCC 35685 / KC583 / Herrer 020/F12,63) TaxID=360095 RepID=A1UR97_BARBK|nr:hypothetical protein BARBAKC583_0162 [Bartonella bacilliformis KC583]